MTSSAMAPAMKPSAKASPGLRWWWWWPWWWWSWWWWWCLLASASLPSLICSPSSSASSGSGTPKLAARMLKRRRSTIFIVRWSLTNGIRMAWPFVPAFRCDRRLHVGRGVNSGRSLLLIKFSWKKWNHFILQRRRKTLQELRLLSLVTLFWRINVNIGIVVQKCQCQCQCLIGHKFGSSSGLLQTRSSSAAPTFSEFKLICM